jgi:8-oxo-dGTP pyrophosphatase MutT (NUDIX family)
MSSEPAYATPRPAASVILYRARPPGGELEVFLLRRHKGASFMSNAFVFPGGTADEGELDLRLTAARELFEEAGVLLADRELPIATLAAWRCAVAAGEARLDRLLADAGASIAVDRMHYFAHWITPSIERKRFSAHFYLAELPPGQTPSFDNRETVDEAWVTPAEAIVRAGELRLPPPQVRTFHDLAPAAARGSAALLACAAERAAHPHPVMPRMCPLTGGGFALLLPWDPDYVRAGQGDLREMPADHPLAVGPSRFVLEEMAWKNIYPAPASPSAGSR